MSKYKIESGIPIPRPIGGAGRRASPDSLRGHLRALKEGESIFVGKKTYKNAANAAHDAMGKGNYAIRVVEGGVRIWRIKP